MNRFVLMSVLDESLPAACYDVITIFLIMLGVIIVVILSNYYIFIPSTFLLISLMLIRRFYIQTARQVKRLEIICELSIIQNGLKYEILIQFV